MTNGRMADTERSGILFVCVANSARSQMAAAFARHFAGGRLEIRSGGTDPSEAVNPTVVAAMLERGIDLRTQSPRRLNDEDLEASDVVITMGCGEECPFYPGKRYIDWEIDDPAGKSVEKVRVIRDEIDRRVRDLIAELLSP